MRLEDNLKEQILHIKERINRFKADYVLEAQWTDTEVADMLQAMLDQAKEDDDQ